MVHLRTLRALSPDDLQAVRGFLLAAHAMDCTQLNDHLRADLDQGSRSGFVATLAHDAAGAIIGYAQASAGNDGFIVDSIVWSAYEGDVDEARISMLRTLLAELPADAGVTWWTREGDGARPLATSLGLQPGRTLLQMRCPLPLPADVTGVNGIVVRPFVVGVDEAAWLEVNNSAFAWHGEQGGWDLAMLRQREHEPWFRPEGFLLHELDHRLAGFCWTKLHPAGTAGDVLVGEIYVIAVHPDYHGLGLGRALTVAGLAALSEAGAEEGMLYVDAGNTAAVGLYTALGFVVSRSDQAYVRPSKGTTS